MDNIGNIYKNMLVEATGDDVNRVSKQHADIDKDIIQKYADEADPKQGKGSRYLDWLVKGHARGNHAPEDTFRLKAALTNFETHKPKLEKKDIGQYNHVSELEDAVQPHLGVLSATAAGDAKNYWGKPEHHEKIFDNGAGLQVFHTKTKEASQAIYGGGHSAGGCHTGWCTAGSTHNRFDHYSDGGKNPLYQIHTPDGKVHQDEFSGDYSGGLRDAKDLKVNRTDLVKENPDLIHVPAFQGKDISYTAPGPKLKEALHAEIKKGKHDVALNHPAVETEHLHTILDNAYNSADRAKTLTHPKADASIVARHAEYQSLPEDESRALFNHPHFGEDHIQKILSHDYGSTKNALFRSDKLNRGHIEQAIASETGSNHDYAAAHPLATDEDRVHMIETKKAAASTALMHMKSPDLIDKHYSKGSEYSISHNQNTPSHTIARAYDTVAGGSYSHDLAMHKNAPADVISKHIKNSSHSNAIEMLGSHKGIESSHVSDAFDHSNHLVKQAAVRHAKAGSDVHDEAFKNPSFHGSISVSKSAKPEHLHELSKSDHDFIRQNVAENKMTTKDTLTNLAADPVTEVAAAADKQLKKRK